MRGKCYSDFKEDGGCVPPPQNHMSDYILDFSHELGMAEPLVGRRVEPLEPRV